MPPYQISNLAVWFEGRFREGLPDGVRHNPGQAAHIIVGIQVRRALRVDVFCAFWHVYRYRRPGSSTPRPRHNYGEVSLEELILYNILSNSIMTIMY